MQLRSIYISLAAIPLSVLRRVLLQKLRLDSFLPKSSTPLQGGLTMMYKTARKHAEDIRLQLHPLCSVLTIAGSVLRHSPLCNDIDLVCLASDSQRLKVRERCLRNSPEIRSDGEQILSIVLNNSIKVQVFFAHPIIEDLFKPTPSNYGSVLLCRTGPKAFCQHICLRAAKQGLHWNPFVGIIKNGKEIIASETEQDIFKALKMKYIQPRNRKGPTS